MATIVTVRCRSCGTEYWLYAPKEEMAEALGVARAEAIEEDRREVADGDLEMAADTAEASGAVFVDSRHETLERCRCGDPIQIDVPR